MSQPPPPPGPPPGPQQPPGAAGDPPGWPPPPPSGSQGGWAPPPPNYPAYGGPPGYMQPRPKHPQATTTLVLGILSLAGGFMCAIGFLLGIPAWIIGHRARREMQEQPGVWSGDGEVTAGWVMGIVSSVFVIIGVTVLLIIVIAAAGSS